MSNMSLGGHSMSTTAHSFVVRYDKLDQNEVKDLLLCFLYVIKNLAEGLGTRDFISFKIKICFFFFCGRHPSRVVQQLL